MGKRRFLVLEKNIEKIFVKRIQKLGGICYKFVSPGNSGVPDRIVVFRKKVIFVELKAEKGKLTELQKRQIGKIRARGAAVAVLYGLDDVLDFLDTLAFRTQHERA